MDTKVAAIFCQHSERGRRWAVQHPLRRKQRIEQQDDITTIQELEWNEVFKGSFVCVSEEEVNCTHLLFLEFDVSDNGT